MSGQTQADIKLFDFLKLERPLQVVDAGSSAIAEVPIYKNLLDNGFAHLNAFEGDDRQIAGIRKAYGDKVSIYKNYLFDGTTQTLHLAHPESGMTSLLKPRSDALSFFNGFEQFGRVEKTETVKTDRLDDIDDLPQIDFLKMDIQGAELTVLKNGARKIQSCLAIQLEVSYICLYENQPSFGDVDVWMRSKGYVPHCFLDVKRWSIAPVVFNNNFRIPGNQLLESDIVYIKDPLRAADLTNTQLKIFAVLAHYCFKSFDLCVFLLRELERRGVLDGNSHIKYLSKPSPA